MNRDIMFNAHGLWGQTGSLFDHLPTLSELSQDNCALGCDFVLKPHSVSQHCWTHSRGYHFSLRYEINDHESMFSFKTGEISELERPSDEASLLLLIVQQVS